jgi:CheY-like chemotaxis protein
MNQTILLVDDDRASCLLLRKMFSSLGYSCDFVHNVSDALRAAASKAYCMVLLDCLLPDQNGWTASHAIRLLPRDGPPPSTIGILSYPDEQMQRRCSEAGMQDVLVKPFCKKAVASCIGKVLLRKVVPSSQRSESTHFFQRVGSGFSSRSAPQLNASPGIQEKQVKTASFRQASMDLLGSAVAPSTLMLNEAELLSLGEFNSF